MASATQLNNIDGNMFKQQSKFVSKLTDHIATMNPNSDRYNMLSSIKQINQQIFPQQTNNTNYTSANIDILNALQNFNNEIDSLIPVNSPNTSNNSNNSAHFNAPIDNHYPLANKDDIAANEQKTNMSLSTINDNYVPPPHNNEKLEEWVIVNDKDLEGFSKKYTQYLYDLLYHTISYQQYDNMKTKSEWKVYDTICQYFTSKDDNNNSNKSTSTSSTSKLLENKRIVRLSINSALFRVLKIIFKQTICKLDCLNNEQFILLTDNFEKDISTNSAQYDDISQFINEYFIKQEYFIDINTDKYIGEVCIKFKKDINNDQYVFVVCYVITREYDKINDNINNIKDGINKKIKKEVDIALSQ